MAELVSSALSKSVLTHTKIVAVIPCFNTQQFISEVVIGSKKYVDEVIVVDDGSTDMTAQIAKAAGAIVLSHDKNLGKGAAMKTGVNKVDADVIIFLDGDGQHNPIDIPKLLEPIIQGRADFVIGSRYLSQSKTLANPFIRKFANAIASFIISFTISIMQPTARFISRKSAKVKLQQRKKGEFIPEQNYRLLNGRFKWITDCTSGFTAMSQKNYGKLNLVSNGFQIETEIIFEQARNGFVIAEVPISCNWEYRLSKLSIVGDGMKTLLLLARKMSNYFRNDMESKE